MAREGQGEQVQSDRKALFALDVCYVPCGQPKVLRALAWKLRSRLEVSGQTSFEVVLAAWLDEAWGAIKRWNLAFGIGACWWHEVVAACGSAQHLCNLSAA